MSAPDAPPRAHRPCAAAASSASHPQPRASPAALAAAESAPSATSRVASDSSVSLPLVLTSGIDRMLEALNASADSAWSSSSCESASQRPVAPKRERDASPSAAEPRTRLRVAASSQADARELLLAAIRSTIADRYNGHDASASLIARAVETHADADLRRAIAALPQGELARLVGASVILAPVPLGVGSHAAAASPPPMCAAHHSTAASLVRAASSPTRALPTVASLYAAAQDDPSTPPAVLRPSAPLCHAIARALALASSPVPPASSPVRPGTGSAASTDLHFATRRLVATQRWPDASALHARLHADPSCVDELRRLPAAEVAACLAHWLQDAQRAIASSSASSASPAAAASTVSSASVAEWYCATHPPGASIPSLVRAAVLDATFPLHHFATPSALAAALTAASCVRAPRSRPFTPRAARPSAARVVVDVDADAEMSDAREPPLSPHAQRSERWQLVHRLAAQQPPDRWCQHACCGHAHADHFDALMLHAVRVHSKANRACKPTSCAAYDRPFAALHSDPHVSDRTQRVERRSM